MDEIIGHMHHLAKLLKARGLGGNVRVTLVAWHDGETTFDHNGVVCTPDRLNVEILRQIAEQEDEIEAEIAQLRLALEAQP